MTTPYLSVFGLLYREKLESFNKDDTDDNKDDTAKTGTWTFAIYLFTWNFVSEIFFSKICKLAFYVSHALSVCFENSKVAPLTQG